MQTYIDLSNIVNPALSYSIDSLRVLHQMYVDMFGKTKRRAKIDK